MFGKKTLPPTPYGYQPPPDAQVVSWECTNRQCGEGEHGPDMRGWPKRCPKCGSLIGSGIVKPPYEHAARRAELDVKLAHPKAEWEHQMAVDDDLLWRFDEALRRNDRPRASEVREEADSVIAQNLGQGSSREYGQRMKLVWTALDFDDLDDAAAELLVWFETADLTTANDNSGVRANGRGLIDMSARFLQHRAARTHSASNVIYQSLTAVMRDANEYMTADNRTGFAAVRAIWS